MTSSVTQVSLDDRGDNIMIIIASMVNQSNQSVNECDNIMIIIASMVELEIRILL